MRSARVLAVLFALGTLALGVRGALADTFTGVDYYTTGSFSGGTAGTGSLTYSSTNTSVTVADGSDVVITYDFSGTFNSINNTYSTTFVSLDNNGTSVPLATGSFGNFNFEGQNVPNYSITGVEFTLDIYQVLPGVVGSGTLAATVSGHVNPVSTKDLMVTFGATSTISSSVPPIEYTVNDIDITPSESLSGTHNLVAAANVLEAGSSVPLPSSGLMVLAMFGVVVCLKVVRNRVAAGSIQ